MILCDYAEAVNGKVYVMGGGWNILFSVGRPLTASVAVILSVPWDRTNERHKLHLSLVNIDDQPIYVEGNPVEVSGEFEVGRPPGVKPGTSLTNPLVWNFAGLPLGVGHYAWRFDVDGEPIARKPFEVAPHPAAVGPPGLTS